MSKLAKDIGKIVSNLAKLEKVQDRLVVSSREIVRACSLAIKMIHNKEMADAEKKVKEAGKMVKEARKIDKELVHIVGQAYQEYAEAAVVLALVKKNDVPSYSELGIPFVPYLLGLMDAVGELRREMLEELKRGDKKSAEYYFEKMSWLYEETVPLRFSNSLLPNFRRKQDVARSQVEQARSELLR